MVPRFVRAQNSTRANKKGSEFLRCLFLPMEYCVYGVGILMTFPTVRLSGFGMSFIARICCIVTL